MAGDTQLYWIGQTPDQVLGIASSDNERLGTVFAEMPGVPDKIRKDLSLDALCLANPEPLRILPDKSPDFWASPAEAARAAGRLAEAVSSLDKRVTGIVRDFCEPYAESSTHRFFQALYSGPGGPGDRFHRAAAIFNGGTDPLYRRRFVDALEQFAGSALKAEAHGAELITVDLGLEGYWAVDGPPSE